MIRIYFAAAVRQGARFEQLATRIAMLERLGEVTTRHMANAGTADLGHRDDAALFAADQRLLASSDVFIGDFSAPSTGAGFMAARALELGKPVLALFEAAQKPSAMIAGNPRIVTKRFEDEDGFARAVHEFLAPLEPKLRAPKVVLAGPPGSGKGTLGTALTKKFGAPHISTGELLRELVATRPEAPLAREVDRFMKAGQLVPAETMRAVVLERLSAKDVKTFGFILDGYPPSRADLENLRAGGIEPDVVLLLECDDATSVERQVKRAARSTDTPDKAKTRLSVFKQEPLSADGFPRSVTVRLDASQPAAQVEARALEALDGLLGEPRRTRSFFPSPPFRDADVRSTRFHFHLDAPSAGEVRALAREVLTRSPAAQGQLKLYPIESLTLGPQVTRWPVYERMPNFRAIPPGDDEAFVTGRLGDGDVAMMRTVLEVTRALGGMTELEEYTGEWVLGLDGRVREESRYTPATSPELAALLAEWRGSSCGELPRLELHLGFDVPRVNGALPLATKKLVKRCADAGLQNGGWFVFKKGDVAAYRSNEFSDLSVEEGEARVAAQARTLQALLAEDGVKAEVSFSLELVHGIWVFAPQAAAGL